MYFHFHSGSVGPVMSRGHVPVSLQGCAPIRSASDVYFSMVSDQFGGQNSNQPTKGLTRGGDLREAQVDVPSSV
jgi:hypothetical protein